MSEEKTMSAAKRHEKNLKAWKPKAGSGKTWCNKQKKPGESWINYQETFKIQHPTSQRTEPAEMPGPKKKVISR